MTTIGMLQLLLDETFSAKCGDNIEEESQFL